MSNEWHPFGDREQEGRPGEPEASRHDQGSASDDTRPLSPSPAAPATSTLTSGTAAPAPETPRRARSLSAAVLVGALVLGGAAGVGGAATYDAVKGDSNNGGAGDLTASPSRNTGTNTSSTSSTAVESVAQNVLPSVVQINVTGSNEEGSGSGIVLTKDGTILTNNHVVSVAGNGGSIVANFNDGTSAKATVVGTDPVTDLAVIKASGVDDATPAEIGKSSDLKVGQQVVAIGSPFGLGATVTSGIVSALDRAVSVPTADDSQGQGGGSGGSGGSSPFGGSPFGGEDPFGQQEQQPQQQQQQGSASQTTTYPAIQTDAAINPGNSGGPLVNLDGQVVGINSSIRTSGSSASEGGSIGLGFAIPMDEALPIINQLRNNQTPTHARLGVTVADNSSGNASSTGAVVKSVEQGGSAADAGIKQGDVITKVGEKVIDGADDLVATIRGDRPGEKVSITLTRGGKSQTVDADLGSDANNQSS